MHFYILVAKFMPKSSLSWYQSQPFFNCATFEFLEVSKADAHEFLYVVTQGLSVS